MLLTSDERSVGLRPVGYQFSATSGDSYDDNWLIIGGRVTAPDGRWSFSDPVLLTDEGRRLSRWLRAAAGGRVAVARPDRVGGWSPSLTFIEPVLAFSLAGRTDGAVRVRVHLSLEASPPWRPDTEGDLAPYEVEIELTEAELLRAADEWDRELLAFPAR
ncbi:WapI family immunity protein [Kitasatospora sp. NPDC001574]